VADLATFLAVGALTGFFAGLLGIGGGIIIVSSLALMFAARGYPAAYVMHMAIGTSLAAIIAGSFASFRAHHRHGAVDWSLVKTMTPGLLAGVLVGSIAARFVPGSFLKLFFLSFMAVLTLQMAVGAKPKATRELPGRAGLVAMAAFIGVVSSMFGGGAAAFGVPFLTWCNVDTHRAIGTCAAMGFPLALAGTVGYAIAGWGIPGMPEWSVGFVYVPAFVAISVTSMMMAPWGAKLAHRLKGPTLRRIFALFLLAMGVKVAISV
jgi:uncharacterized membrane protein YfcA